MTDAKYLNGNFQWVVNPGVVGTTQTIVIPATATTSNWTYQIQVNGSGYGITPTPPAQKELDLNDTQKKIDAYDRAMRGIG